MGSLYGEFVNKKKKKKAMWLYPKVSGFNPCERWGHSACCSNGVIYLYGGCCGGLHFSDVLMLDTNKMVWSRLVTTGHQPGPRDSHSAVLVRNRIIVLGGTNGSKKVNDLHVLDLSTREWTRPICDGDPPSPRESHTATILGDYELVIFGGSGEGEANYLNDLHILDLKTMRWTRPELTGDIPGPRDSHVAVAIGRKLLVYGGDSGDRYHGEVYLLDMDTLTWSRLAVQGSSPTVRAGHAAVNIGTKVYVVGGVGDKHYYNDVWVLDISTCSWSTLEIQGQQPQGRFSHSAVIIGSNIMIFGGCGEDERPLGEFLILHLGDEHPHCRYNISMCKKFGNHWNQEVPNPPQLFGNFNPRKRRTSDLKVVEIESEQEEHSLSFSQHSSPSQSDQEQTPVGKLSSSVADSVMEPHAFAFFKPRQEAPSDCEFNNIIGAEIRGIVDGAFDSGYLMTANVDGKILRGVLFAPVPAGVISRADVLPHSSSSQTCQIAMAPPNSNSNYVGPFLVSSSQQPTLCTTPNSGYHLRQSQPAGPSPVTQGVSSLVKETKIGSDLQGVVLTLGGPGSGHGD